MARTSPSLAARRRPAAEVEEPRSRTVRVAVAMPRALLRELLALRLSNEPALELVACVDGGPELREVVERRKPAVLLLDEELHGDASDRFIRRLRVAAPEVRVLLISARPTEEGLTRTLRAGGAGVVPTQGDYAMLVRAIRAVSRGEVWANRRFISRALEGSLASEHVGSPDAVLSAREREIVDAVGRGLRNKEIARRLGISEKTAKNHLSNIFRKLKVDNRFAVGLYSLDISPKP
jgi:DNA-binding NarL/FixJ family response regulator